MIGECANSVRRVNGLFALAEPLEVRLAKARGQARLAEAVRRRLDQLTPSLPPSHGYSGTGLARAWTHSLPARSACALSLRENRLAHSQRSRLKGEP